MKRVFLITIAAVALATTTFAAPATMRVDYFHTGNDKQEYFSLDRIVMSRMSSPNR